MPHNLFLIRHAQAHDSQVYNADKERELKPAGIIEATELGKYLKASCYHADLIISSDASRAKATARLIASEIHYPSHQIHHVEKIYSGDIRNLLTLIGQTSDSVEQLFMVGHNPTILELINYLSDTQKNSMQPCELSVLTFNERWSQLSAGCGICTLNYPPYN